MTLPMRRTPHHSTEHVTPRLPQRQNTAPSAPLARYPPTFLGSLPQARALDDRVVVVVVVVVRDLLLPIRREARA